MEIPNCTALELGQAIRTGRLSCVEVLEGVYDRIDQSERELHAYITLCRDEAFHQARLVQQKIEAGELKSPLAGVPIAVKDNICTRGIRTSCASKMLGDFRPAYNATVIDRLEAAGMIVIGKTNMDEFAMGSTTETSYFGPTRNPWNLNRVPGGSSGGSAAAVASGMAACALGSDTGGSIRQPASFCGVVGLKPTYGRVSRYGLVAYASSLDQIGPIAADVRDCAALLEILAGKDPLDGTSLDADVPAYAASLTGRPAGLKIGLPGERFLNGIDADVASALLSFAKVLEKEGAQIREIDLPLLDYAIPTYYILAAAEASSNLARFDGIQYGFRSDECRSVADLYCATRSEGFGAEVKKRILLGTFALSAGYYDAYYQKALKVKNRIRQSYDELFSECDLLLSPAAPSTAPELGKSLRDPLRMYRADLFTVSANLAGLPALSVPCGLDRNQMPIGVQILGRHLDEQRVLDVGYTFEQITGYHRNSKGEAYGMGNGART